MCQDSDFPQLSEEASSRSGDSLCVYPEEARIVSSPHKAQRTAWYVTCLLFQSPIFAFCRLSSVSTLQVFRTDSNPIAVGRLLSQGENQWLLRFPLRQNQPSVVEKVMAPHSSTLAWKSHGWRSLVGCSPWDREESDTTERLHIHFSLSCIGEGNGNPLQCSCLENPKDRGASWTAVYGVAQSRTRLKRLSSSSSNSITKY